MYLIGRGCDETNWIHLVQNKIKWRTLVNAAMNHRVHELQCIPSGAQGLSASQEELCSM